MVESNTASNQRPESNSELLDPETLFYKSVPKVDTDPHKKV